MALVALTALAAGPLVPSPGAPADRLAPLQALVGADPVRARGLPATVHDDALRAGQVDVRLAVDELECRLLNDLDISLAERVAAARFASGRAAGDVATRLHWLRLCSCHAGAVLERGDEGAGYRELNEVLAASSADAFVSA